MYFISELNTYAILFLQTFCIITERDLWTAITFVLSHQTMKSFQKVQRDIIILNMSAIECVHSLLSYLYFDKVNENHDNKGQQPSRSKLTSVTCSPIQKILKQIIIIIFLKTPAYSWYSVLVSTLNKNPKKILS